MRQLTYIKPAAANVLALAALAWPSIACGVRELAERPLERALRAAWCGEPYATANLIGHCVTGWVGAFILMLAALIALDLASTERLRRLLFTETLRLQR